MIFKIYLFSSFTEACNCLVKCHTTKHPHFICGDFNLHHFICGDFNLPNIDWSVPVSLGGLTSDFFIWLCRRLNLMQVTQEHTCNTSHILDLLLCDVFSSSKLLFHEICPFLARTCDHSGLLFGVNLVASTASHTAAP